MSDFKGLDAPWQSPTGTWWVFANVGLYFLCSDGSLALTPWTSPESWHEFPDEATAHQHGANYYAKHNKLYPHGEAFVLWGKKTSTIPITIESQVMEFE